MASIRRYVTAGGDVRYEVRWLVDGKQRSKTQITHGDARTFKNDIERKLRMGELHATRPALFGEAEDEFFARFIAGMEGRVKPRENTVADMQYRRLHLKPLRKTPIDKVDLEKMERVILPLAQESPRMAEMTLSLAKRILRSAQKRRQPVNLSALEATVAHAQPRATVFLTWEQAQHVASFMPEFIWRIVPVAVLTLCRRGELLGLRDRDVDFDNQTVQVFEQADGKKRTATKTRAGRRTIDVGPTVLGLLRAQQTVRWANPQGLLFPSMQGKPFDGSRFYNRYYKPACRDAGHHALTFHGLRHSGVSLMIATDIDVKTISERMGHKDGGALVLRTYGHLYKGRGKEAAARLEAFVSGSPS